jgi:hypothetical protein
MYQKVLYFLVRLWSRDKQDAVAMILDGKPLYESDPRAQRILRRLQQSGIWPIKVL